MYCGEIKSKNSVPVGNPILAISLSNFRAILNPSLILKELSNLGSLIRPFQPIVVLGFSKINSSLQLKPHFQFHLINL